MTEEKRQHLIVLISGLKKIRKWDSDSMHEALLYVEIEASYLRALFEATRGT